MNGQKTSFALEIEEKNDIIAKLKSSNESLKAVIKDNILETNQWKQRTFQLVSENEALQAQISLLKSSSASASTLLSSASCTCHQHSTPLLLASTGSPASSDFSYGSQHTTTDLVEKLQNKILILEEDRALLNEELRRARSEAVESAKKVEDLTSVLKSFSLQIETLTVPSSSSR